MAGERVFHAKPTRTQNRIPRPPLLRLAVLKKPETRLFGTFGVHLTQAGWLQARGGKQRGEKL